MWCHSGGDRMLCHIKKTIYVKLFCDYFLKLLWICYAPNVKIGPCTLIGSMLPCFGYTLCIKLPYCTQKTSSSLTTSMQIGSVKLEGNRKLQTLWTKLCKNLLYEEHQDLTLESYKTTQTPRRALFNCIRPPLASSGRHVRPPISSSEQQNRWSYENPLKVTSPSWTTPAKENTKDFQMTWLYRSPNASSDAP